MRAVEISFKVKTEFTDEQLTEFCTYFGELLEEEINDAVDGIRYASPLTGDDQEFECYPGTTHWIAL